MPAFRPYSEDALQYYLRGLTEAYGAEAHSAAAGDVSEEMTQPYYDGLADGERYATEGFPTEPICFDLGMGHSALSTAGELVDIAFEGAAIVGSISRHGLAAALGASVFEGPILFLMVSIAATTHYKFPEEVLRPSTYDDAVSFLSSIDVPYSMELFIGGGVDELASDGCHLRMTRLYKSFDQALAEVSAMGRPSYLVCSVRTDMSGGLKIVDYSM